MVFFKSFFALPFQFIALVFLVVSVFISAPFTNKIYLSQTDDLRYGFFGYCVRSTGDCTYKSPKNWDLSSFDQDTNWLSSSDRRNDLVKTFYVGGIAVGLAALSLITTFIGMCIRARFWHFLNVVIAFFAFVASAVTTVVVFLTYYPKVSWASWILVPASVLLLLSLFLVVSSMTELFRKHSSANESYIKEADNGNDTLSTDHSYAPPPPQNTAFIVHPRDHV